MDQKPALDKNFFYALVICFALFWGWNKYIEVKYPDWKKSQDKAVKEAQVPADALTETKSAPNAQASTKSAPVVQAKKEETFWTYEDEYRKMVFSSRGGRIIEVELKKYSDEAGPLHQLTSRSPGLMLLELDRPGVDIKYADLDYALTPEGTDQLKMTAQLGDTTIQKTVVFFKNSYKATLAVGITGLPKDTKSVLIDNSILLTPYEQGSFFQPTQAGGLNLSELYFDSGSKAERHLFEPGTPVDFSQNQTALAAVGSKYFTSAWLNKSNIIPNAQGFVQYGQVRLGTDPTVAVFHSFPVHVDPRRVVEDLRSNSAIGQSVRSAEFLSDAQGSRIAVNMSLPGDAGSPEDFGKDILSKSLAYGAVTLRLSMPILDSSIQNPNYHFDFYVGPKNLKDLVALGDRGKEIVDYGMFSVLAFPMLDLMNWFYRVFRNYGVAIILLTLVVRLITLPFTYISFKSMKVMQKLQPEMNRLKEKYKDNKQQLNVETMKLMKENKANPLAGCLPILLQMPVFFALFQLLQNSIELYRAPFGLWIHDLSIKDPLYVLPILMGITMYFQQKLTPSQMDPAQQKVMQFMPVIFSFMMISLPSGLTLYIFVSSLFGIVQQVIMMRDTKGTSSQLARPVST